MQGLAVQPNFIIMQQNKYAYYNHKCTIKRARCIKCLVLEKVRLPNHDYFCNGHMEPSSAHGKFCFQSPLKQVEPSEALWIYRTYSSHGYRGSKAKLLRKFLFKRECRHKSVIVIVVPKQHPRDWMQEMFSGLAHNGEPAEAPQRKIFENHSMIGRH